MKMSKCRSVQKHATPVQAKDPMKNWGVENSQKPKIIKSCQQHQLPKSAFCFPTWNLSLMNNSIANLLNMNNQRLI